MAHKLYQTPKFLGTQLLFRIDIFVEGLGKEFKILNVYGPYLDRLPFWETLLKLKLLKAKNLILGGDLNFSLGEAETWGPTARPDPLTTRLTHLLSSSGLLDITPRKLLPTWRNMRSGEARVEKHIDRFLVAETLLEEAFQVRQWIGAGGISDHCPLWLVLEGGPKKPPSPFKFNATWLEDESFRDLVKKHWRPFDSRTGTPAGVHFAKNLKTIKALTIPWAKEKRQNEERELQATEEQLEAFYQEADEGLLTDITKNNIKTLEARRKQLLAEQEATWRLKSRAIWLEQGDENTKFFHAFSKGQKASNTIWNMKDPEGRTLSTFPELAELGKNHFKTLYKADQRENIAKIVKLALYYPSFVNEQNNRDLYSEVSASELKETIGSFQKDKIPGPDGWTIEFYLAFFDLLGADLLRVVEETRLNGLIHPPFNTTFLALIPKKDEPTSFEDFRPISLCNCIYKIIAKIISRRLKPILSEVISKEQFGFLNGRQIHEAIGVAQEGLHSLKSHRSKGVVLKIDLSKAFDRVNWSFIRLLLTHLGFEVPFIRWIMACISSINLCSTNKWSSFPFLHL
jgi:hypothetical protein